jgi:hypothetical protein
MKVRVILTALAAVVLICAVLPRSKRAARGTRPAGAPQANRVGSVTGEFKPEEAPAPLLLAADVTHPKRGFLAERKAELSPGELKQLEWLFRERLKPALQRWAQAYDGRIPFNPEEVAMENLHSRLGDHPGRYAYTFMVNGSTLSFVEQEGNYAVGYLSAPDAPKLNDVHGGQTPIVTVPVTKEQVIAMVKADIGEEFPMEEVRISPTGLACAINGGAFVRVKPLGKNNEVGVVNLVIGPDGKLISYASDPFHKLYAASPRGRG